MTTRYTQQIAPALAAALDGDERVLVASPLVKDPGTTEDVSVGDELKNLLDPTILLGLGTHPGNLAQRAVFGRAVIGGRGSTARILFDAVAACPAPAIAVTTTRLLIVETSSTPASTTGLWERWFGPVRTVARGIHEVRRDGILGAVAAPAGVLRRGRILFGFTDGSGCMLVCAVPSTAAEVVAMIGAPPPPAPPPDRPGTQESP